MTIAASQSPAALQSSGAWNAAPVGHDSDGDESRFKGETKNPEEGDITGFPMTAAALRLFQDSVAALRQSLLKLRGARDEGPGDAG